MIGGKRLTSFVAIALSLQIWSADAAAQVDNNPFSEAGRPSSPMRQRARDPFGGTGPFELLGEPEPTLALPETQPQPEVLEPLEQLLRAAQADANVNKAATCKCLGENSGSIDKIKKALAGPLLSRGLEYTDTALEQVASDISAEFGIAIQLDMSALDDAGLGPDESVTVNLHGISLRSALNHVLRQLNLTFILVDEVMLITTPAVAEEQLKVCVYDVRDLIAGEQDNYRVNELIDVIESSVAPQTWTASGGGVGDIRTIHPGLLVVSQSQLVHEEIGELLLVLRQIGRQIPDNLGALSGQTARRVVTRHYLLEASKPDDQAAFQTQLRDLIVKLVPDQTWAGTLADGENVLLSVLPDRVVVRHTVAVQRQVEATLVDIGMVAPQRRNVGRGGGGGGFFRPAPQSAIDD